MRPDDFIEQCVVHQNFYGTNRHKVIDTIQSKQICILDIDVQGGIKCHEQFPDWNYVFINCKSIEEIEKRLRAR